MKSLVSSKTNQSAGFTLIEVLVVVVIAAVLAAIAAPSWQGFLNRQRVSAVKSDLLQTLKNAQQDAIQRRISVPVRIDTAAAAPTVTVNNGAALVLSEASNPGNVKLSAYRVGSGGTGFDTVIFDYRGAPTFRKGADNTTISDVPPFVISVNIQGSTAKQCVIVASLLGALKTASNAQCDNPTL